MSEGRRVKILVVEDHQYLQQVYQAELEEEGFDVAIAENKSETIAFLENGKLDIILLAYRLQGPGTGLDILKAIRSSDWPEIPVILTAVALTSDDLVSLKHTSPRFDAYVPMSYDNSLLLQTIKTLLKGRK